ncbi:MAG: hypothetical protein HY726_05810 [Candidatus Rokubacteria bacterium]|nr:hypothetical protein [Candidatus Rokubacteria bacterium]
MFDRPYDPEFLKSIFEQTQVLRKPLSGIIAGYHVLPYVLVGPQEERSQRSVEIRGKIRVSPRLVISPSHRGQTYGELFHDDDVMDRALVARVFSFLYASRHQVQLEGEELRIVKSDCDPQAQLNRALDDLMRREIINTGVIFCPRVKFYPVSIDRFLTEILDEEFRG